MGFGHKSRTGKGSREPTRRLNVALSFTSKNSSLIPPDAVQVVVPKFSTTLRSPMPSIRLSTNWNLSRPILERLGASSDVSLVHTHPSVRSSGHAHSPRSNSFAASITTHHRFWLSWLCCKLAAIAAIDLCCSYTPLSLFESSSDPVAARAPIKISVLGSISFFSNGCLFGRMEQIPKPLRKLSSYDKTESPHGVYFATQGKNESVPFQ